MDELAATVSMPRLITSASTVKASMSGPVAASNHASNEQLNLTETQTTIIKNRKTSKAAAAAAASLILRGGSQRGEHDASADASVYKNNNALFDNASKSMNSIAFLYQSERSASVTSRAIITRGLTNRVHMCARPDVKY